MLVKVWKTLWRWIPVPAGRTNSVCRRSGRRVAQALASAEDGREYLAQLKRRPIGDVEVELNRAARQSDQERRRDIVPFCEHAGQRGIPLEDQPVALEFVGAQPLVLAEDVVGFGRLPGSRPAQR